MYDSDADSVGTVESDTDSEASSVADDEEGAQRGVVGPGVEAAEGGGGDAAEATSVVGRGLPGSATRGHLLLTPTIKDHLKKRSNYIVLKCIAGPQQVRHTDNSKHLHSF